MPRRKYRVKDMPEYIAWKNMRARCKPGRRDSKFYYDRGIRVSEAFDTFEAFLDHVGYRPEGTSLDRINNNGNYAPGNVRWATQRTQKTNRSDNRLITAFGRKMTMIEWSVESGIPLNVIWFRIHRTNWSPEDCVSTPVMTALEAAHLGANARWK